MGNENLHQQYNSYLGEIISDFDRNKGLLKVTEPGFSAYYAGLRLEELKSRLRINITYCENHSISSDEYKEAKKRV